MGLNLVLPVTLNTSGKVLIQTVSESHSFLFNSYIITSIGGENVVVDPTEMPQKSVCNINPAAILCTHEHFDHTDVPFTDSYDIPKILYEKGDIRTKDFRIYSIASSHYNDTIDNSNFLIVFEVDGLRIVHMGDIGQNKLTEEQLEAIGKIDIAFMQFENNYSDMSVSNRKGFTIIEQLNPKIIIPTHCFEKGDAMLAQKYGCITEFNNLLEVSKEDLPEKSLCVYRILNTHQYQ